MKRLLFLFVVAMSSASRVAVGFAQMTSHGYASCVACHVSPSGGGILSAYGRSLSRELLSTWGVEGEEAPLYGAVKPPDWLLLGGDMRWLQLVSKSRFVEQARFFLMQADVEAAAQTGDVQFVATFGYQSPSSRNDDGSRFFSRRHYVQVRLSEQDLVRAGKFEAAFGIRWPDHYRFPRRELGWDEGSESYRLEWSHIAERWEGIVSASLGRPDANALGVERGLTARFAKYLGEGSQVAWSVHYGTNDAGPRVATGPSASLALVERWMLFLEAYGQKLLGGTRGTNTGVVLAARENYEALRGLHLFAVQEYAKPDVSVPGGDKAAFELGFQWFPRPHLEFSGALRKQTSPVPGAGATDAATLLLHYYL